MEPCAANDRGIDSSAVGRENAVGEASKQTFLCPDSNKENVCGVEDASVFEPVLLSSHGKELTNTRAAPVRGVLASLSNSNHETAAMTESSFPTVASIAGGKVSFLKHRTSSMYKKPIESKQENMSDETPDSLAACSKKASTKNVSFVPIATRSQQKQRNPLQCRGKELSRITPSPGKLLLFPDGKLASPGLSYSPKSSAAAVFQSPPPTTLRRSSPPSSTSSTSSYASKPMGGVLANIPMEEGANALNLRVVVSDEAMGFPLVLDAMLTEATMRQSHAVYWSHNGEAFVVDCNQVEELEELLLKYFKHSKYSSLQRQLNIYGFKKYKTGEYSGSFHHPDFHRDKASGIDLAPIKRNTPKKSPFDSSTTTMRLRRTVATTTLSDGVPSVTASGNQNRTKTSAHDKRRHVSTLPGAELVTPPNQVSSQTRIRTRSRTSPPPISTAPPTNAKRPKTTRIRISLNKGGVSNINQTTKDATANGQAAEKEERNIPPHLPKDNVPPKSREAMPKFQASSFAHDEDLNNAALAIYNSQSSDFNFDLQLLDLDLDETPLKYQTKTEDKEKHPGGSTTRVGYHQTEQQPSGNFGTFSQYERQVFTENTSYNPVPNQRGQSQFQHGHNPPQTFHHQPPLAWEAQASASLAKTTFGKGGSWYPGAQHYSRRPSVEDFSKLNNFQDTSALVSPRTAFSTMEETVSTNEVESEGTIKMKLFKADNVAESPIETTNKSLASPVDTATSKTISGKLETVSSYHFFVEKMSEPCDFFHETSMADFSPMETRSVTHRHNLVKFNQTTSCIPHPVMPQQNQKSQQISQYPTGSYSHAVAPVYHMAPHNYGQQQQQHHQLMFSASSAARVLPFGASHFPIVNAPAATMNTNNKKGKHDTTANLYLDWNAKGPGSGPVTF